LTIGFTKRKMGEGMASVEHSSAQPEQQDIPQPDGVRRLLYAIRDYVRAKVGDPGTVKRVSVAVTLRVLDDLNGR
jgi:hypothetical protein